MGLFVWIKHNPAGDRPLGGLFVMDEAQTFAPSGAMTPCTGSTLALASQARKYGLGLVFATQAPRGIHNQIIGNCATQLVGFLNHPTQVAAVKDMVDAKQAKDLHVTELATGDFYLRAEGQPYRRVTTPLCLSNHPKSALTPEEVVALARQGR
jgi:DNA helicase HerA-like ATPase